MACCWQLRGEAAVVYCGTTAMKIDRSVANLSILSDVKIHFEMFTDLHACHDASNCRTMSRSS
jgi:hypothetical protein